MLLLDTAGTTWLPGGVALGVGVMAFGVPVDGVAPGVGRVFGVAVAVGTVRVVVGGKTPVGNVVWVGVLVVGVDAPSVVETLQEVPEGSGVVLSGVKRGAVLVGGALWLPSQLAY